MALLDDLEKFVKDNTLDGSWMKSNLRERCAKFLEEENINGGGGGFLKVTESQDSVLDKTWKEIKDAIDAGWYVSVCAYEEESSNWSQTQIMTAYSEEDSYTVEVGDTFMLYQTDSENGYPALGDDGK